MTSTRVLRWLNLALPLLQILVTILAFYTGHSFEESTASAVSDPPIVPAAYAFTIWTLIYAGCVAYGVFQFLPAQRSHPLYRTLRPWTASAFAGTVSWLVAARFNLTWLTVVFIFWMLGSLLPAFMAFMRQPSGFSTKDQIFTVAPLSIFSGWVTIAVFANVSAWLHQNGMLNRILTPAGWAILMIAAAAAIGCRLVAQSRNVPFAFTLCWALVAILVANLTREYHPAVSVTAGVAAAFVLVTLWRAKRHSAIARS